MNSKLLVTAYPGTVGTLVFPLLSTLADCRFTYQAHGGSQNYGVWQLDPGDIVQFKNEEHNVLYFEKGSSVECMIRDGVMYLFNYSGNYEKRGQIQGDYETGLTRLGNRLKCDGSQAPVPKSDYPGLLAKVQLMATTVPIGSGAGQWGEENPSGHFPNKKKWGVSATHIQVPDVSEMTEKYLAAAGTPGVYEADKVGPFTAIMTVPKGNSYTGNPNNDRFGNGDDNPQNVTIASSSFNTGNTETTVKNFGLCPYVYL